MTLLLLFCNFAVATAFTINHAKKRATALPPEGIRLGIGECVGSNAETFHIEAGQTCYQKCATMTGFACYGYAYSEAAINNSRTMCKLYNSTVKAKAFADVVDGEMSLKITCFAMKPSYNGDFPFRAVSQADFVACRNGKIGAGQIQIQASQQEHIHAQAEETYSTYCAETCRQFKYFYVKAHGYAANAQGPKKNDCFCIERYTKDGTDRFATDTYFGSKVSDDQCPSWDCVYESDGCVWKTDWAGHIAIYKSPFPADGDSCPDHASSLDHRSIYIFISGKQNLTGVHYKAINVSSPSKCAAHCKDEGPSVRDHVNETCHAYTVHRVRGGSDHTCYLFDDPIPEKSMAHYENYKAEDRKAGLWHNYLCVLRTCIQETSCKWGPKPSENYHRVKGFKFIGNGTFTAGGGGSPTNCDEICAKACTDKGDACKAYQCSISTNHCYLFASASADNTHQVSDVSLCVKEGTTSKCFGKNGATAVSHTNSPCKCGDGGNICTEGAYCTVSDHVGSCLNPEEIAPNKPCPCETTGLEDGDKVCGTDGTTYNSTCMLQCAIVNSSTPLSLDYVGKCGGPKSDCSEGNVTATCFCGGQQCPSGAKCTSNVCSTTCSERGEEIGGVCVKYIEDPTPRIGPKSDEVHYNNPCSDATRAGWTEVSRKDGPCALPSCKTNPDEECTCEGSEGNITCSAVEKCVVQPESQVLGTINVPTGCYPVATGPGHESEVGNNGTYEVCTLPGGAVVCEGACYAYANGTKSCISNCLNETADNAICKCGDATSQDACAKSECKVGASGKSRCQQHCTDAKATDCVCGSGSTSELCHSGSVCGTNLNATWNATCIDPCTGNNTETCVCGSGTDTKSCGANSECGSTGNCVSTESCDAGGTDCRCGGPNGTICEGGSICGGPENSTCLVNCTTPAQTGCICGNTYAACEGSGALANRTYCQKDSSTGESSCQAPCSGFDGVSENTDNSSCPCAPGVECGTGQFCVNNGEEGTADCQSEPVNTTCAASGGDEQSGQQQIAQSCKCGGMACPANNYCSESEGLCTAARLDDCAKNVLLDAMCVCSVSGDDYKRDMCLAGEICSSDPNKNDAYLCNVPVVKCEAEDVFGGLPQVLQNILSVLPTPQTPCYCGGKRDGDLCEEGETTCTLPNATCSAGTVVDSTPVDTTNTADNSTSAASTNTTDNSTAGSTFARRIAEHSFIIKSLMKSDTAENSTANSTANSTGTDATEDSALLALSGALNSTGNSTSNTTAENLTTSNKA